MEFSPSSPIQATTYLARKGRAVGVGLAVAALEVGQRCDRADELVAHGGEGIECDGKHGLYLVVHRPYVTFDRSAIFLAISQQFYRRTTQSTTVKRERQGRVRLSRRAIEPLRACREAIRICRVTLVRSKQRVVDHGEVLTPPWIVEAMLDLVQAESERIDSRVLEPACGSGNFLVQVLRRKLVAVELKYKSDFEKRQYGLLSLMCTYGIELLEDNVAECRQNLLEIFDASLTLDDSDDLHRAAAFVLSLNIVHGDAMSMRTSTGEPIVFAEWGYLGKGKFQRRDFRLDVLTQMSSFGESTLFGDLGKQDIFVPVRSYPPLTLTDLASG
jgi:hypothetical protein